MAGRKRGRLQRMLENLGPGIITGASDNDPNGIATYAEVGAQFGLSPGSGVFSLVRTCSRRVSRSLVTLRTSVRSLIAYIMAAKSRMARLTIPRAIGADTFPFPGSREPQDRPRRPSGGGPDTKGPTRPLGPARSRPAP